MKATVLTCFESNEERVRFVCDAFRLKGYDTGVITTGFSHVGKQKRENVPEGYQAVDTLPYQKNLSLKRMRSHKKFAEDAFRIIREQKPDLIWVMAPANSLIKEADLYKKENPSVKIIIDMIDMWPESLPMGFSKDLFPFSAWKNIRKDHLSCADYLVSECDLYQEILKEEYKGPMRTVYWSRDSKAVKGKTDLPDDKLSLCYIGSINNIIDIERIAELIQSCDTPVVLHVIGGGENREKMIGRMNQVCEVVYHGVIRDEKEKSNIFRKCHAGINIYKEGLYIGLTVKCIDYFEHGLPIISNIRGDTWKLVEKYHAGINTDQDTMIRSDEIKKLRRNNTDVYRLFEENFTKEIFIRNCQEILEEVTK